jgi:hypothetical protein
MTEEGDHVPIDTTFREAVWLFPIAFTLHVAEESPRFTTWARIHASAQFTMREYVKIHIAGIISAVFFAALMSRFPNRSLIFLFFAFVFGPALFFNTIFHVGATVVTRTYCPGLITALTLYMPVFYVLSRAVWSENLLRGTAFGAALVIAGAFHFWEVGHNVFKAW